MDFDSTREQIYHAENFEPADEELLEIFGWAEDEGAEEVIKHGISESAKGKLESYEPCKYDCNHGFCQFTKMFKPILDETHKAK